MVASQVQKELFKKWLKENRNISESTFISYTEGVLDKIHEVIKLSNDAKLKNLNPDLYSYDTLDKYDKFFNILKNDPNFDIVNKTGQAQSGWLSTPLNHYRRYLEAQPQENNSTEKLIEYIKQYKVFKSSNEYDEEYKWDYAKKHQGDFNTLDNFENKINSLENYNIRPYFLQRTGLNNLMQPYNIETFKNSLKILFDENKNLEIRIKEFLNNLHHLLKNDVHWNNKNMLPDEVDASYFLFTNNYEKYLLFNQKTSFNCFAKHFGLFDLLDKSDKVKRYIRFQEYCQNQLIPIMNDTLGCQNTLLDAQDFIRFVDKYILKNINNLEYNKDAVKTVQYKETHMNENTNPLNQILYGPPGTGKTYNTVIKAIEITNPELIQKDKDGNVENYELLKEKFDALKQQGQIEFVTFHQSYSYEEFVEGIKPDLESNELKYKLDSGVFKRICQNAAKTMTDNFDEVYEKFINDLADYNEDNLFKLKTGKGKTFGITVNSNKNLSIYMGKNLTKWGTLTKENLKNLSDWQYYANPIYTYLKNNYNLVVTETENSIQSHILIIDEINRGNISKIFGELITLIEEDKRETLSVKLPYSQDNFTVPKNLYIIGTMNTSDRSIASIDIALRRRFKFVEMMPRPEKLVDKNNQPLMVEDINLQNLLKTINERISYILDRDHQIGHSYFMNWKNYDMTTLKNVWFDEIMPLLNEYFYSDWDKLQAILGKANEIGVEKSFIVKIKKPNLPYEADCSDEETYYNFVIKEDVNETDFRTMLKNAQLIESKSNVTSKAD